MISIQRYDKTNKELAHQLIAQVALIERRVQPDSYWNHQVLSELLALERTHLLVAVSDVQGKPVVAYCLYQVMFENAEILRMGTHPKWQRRGIGERLLDFLFMELSTTSKEVDCLLLEVRADNKPAIELYKKQGFWQIDCRKGYYKNADKPAVDGLVMKKDMKVST